MTTSSDVFDTFIDNVFGHASIQAISPQVLSYEVFAESEYETQEIYHEEEINFFECIVTRGISYPLIGGASSPEYKFLVEIRYTREKDALGENASAVRDAIDTLVDVVFSELGHTFGGLVDYATAQEEPATITLEQVSGQDCFRSVTRFQGSKLS